LIEIVIATKSNALKKLSSSRRWTFDELAAELPESNQPTELWDGELVMSPAPSFFHQEIADRFHDHLKGWIRPRQLGKTAAAPVDMILAPHRAVQPDVVFISNERRGIIGDKLSGAVDLVAEVISPESRRRDRFDKRDLYEQHGVKEYWLIDPEAETVEVLYLVRGEFHLAGRWRPGEKAASKLLSGFKVPVAALFEKS